MKMPAKFTLRNPINILVTFIIAFSLVCLPGLLSVQVHYPMLIPTVRANPQPCGPVHSSLGTCIWTIIPGGPFTDVLQNKIFNDAPSEFTALLSNPPLIDLATGALAASYASTFLNNPSYWASALTSSRSYYEIDFHLDNNFWGCNFNFGNSLCGVDIRQGIAHLVDKTSFVTNEPDILAGSSAVDNPVPKSNGGLLPPNPCAWDALKPQAGATCIVGSSGGTAFHLAAAPALGAGDLRRYAWQQPMGSLDFCAAADHFIRTGIATGKDANCVLTGINAQMIAGHEPNFFIRNDDITRLGLGDSYAGSICALFTGSFVFPCDPYLSVTHGPASAFNGFTTSNNNVNQSWWMYTALWTHVFPFDSSLYQIYNSRFVSGIASIKLPTPGATCDSKATPTFSAHNYLYVCNIGYDSLSTQMEFSPCFNAPGDPGQGATANAPGANCPGTAKLSAISAGIQAEDAFGQGEYAIPVWSRMDQFAFVNGLNTVVDLLKGTLGWTLNTIKQIPGLSLIFGSEQTVTLSPFLMSSYAIPGSIDSDYDILHGIYDSLMITNPADDSQLIDWMAVSSSTTPLPNSSLTYTPPTGTVSTYRFVLRSDLFSQDGRKVTAFDVAFSYLALLGTGSPQSTGLASMTGITILGPTQFDINVNAVGPFTKLFLTSPAILPGRYWTNAGASSYDAAIATCTATGAPCYPAQYTLDSTATIGSSTIPAVDCAMICSFPPTNLDVNPAQTFATYDPINNGILIGSGPWQCGTGSGTGGLGQGCVVPTGSSYFQNPSAGNSYTLQRFGKGFQPASSVSGIYFRSAGNLALWIWSQDNGDFTHDFLNFSVVAACFGRPADPLGSTGPCDHFQQGIGANGGPMQVGLSQVSIVNRFVGLNWVSPYNWVSGPPTAFASLPVTLYENGMTLNPSSVAGCTTAYPSGGYDC